MTQEIEIRTQDIYWWLNRHVCAQEDNRPVLRDVHIEGGYLFAADGYAMARVPLRFVDTTEWYKAHCDKHGSELRLSPSPDRLPCGNESIEFRDRIWGHYPDVKAIFLNAWDYIGDVDMRDLVFRYHDARLETRQTNYCCPYVDVFGARVSTENVKKLIFLRSNIHTVARVSRKVEPDVEEYYRALRFEFDNGIEVYVMPMFK